VGTPTSHAAWVQTTLPMSEGGCWVTSAADVAPVARLPCVMQFLTRAELMLGCDRRDCLTPSMRIFRRPWNHWQVGRGQVTRSCRTGMSDASTGGNPG